MECEGLFTYRRHTLPSGRKIFGLAETESEVWLLALSGHWFRCRVQSIEGRPLSVRDADESIRGGILGSPTIAPDGRAIGVVCTSSGGAHLDTHSEGGPNTSSHSSRLACR